MFLIGGTEAIAPFVSDELTTPLLFALGALATYFRMTPKVNFNEN
jgi:hypothetical protein